MRKRIEQIIIQALEYQRGDAWLTLTEASNEFRLSKKNFLLIHKGRRCDMGRQLLSQTKRFN